MSNPDTITSRIKYFLCLALICLFSACNETEQANEPSHNVLNAMINEANGFQYASFQTQDFNGILTAHFALPNSPASGQIRLLASYTEASFGSETDFFTEMPAGVSLVYEEKGQEFHKLYINENGRFVEKTEYRLPVNEEVTVNTLRRLSYLANKQSQSLLLIINQSFEPSVAGSAELRAGFGEGESGLADVVMNQTEGEDVLVDVAFGCMSCGATRAGECKIHPDYGYIYCKPGGCFASEHNKEASSKAASMMLNLDQAREYRDKYLTNSVRGKEYIGYYETLSNVLEEMSFIDKVSLAANYDVALKVYGILDKFTKDDGRSVLINSEDKEYLLKFINDHLMSVSRSLEYQSILQTVKNDLERYSNLSVEEVRSDFNGLQPVKTLD